jgi:hypothetical protein
MEARGRTRRLDPPPDRLSGLAGDLPETPSGGLELIGKKMLPGASSAVTEDEPREAILGPAQRGSYPLRDRWTVRQGW